MKSNNKKVRVENIIDGSALKNLVIASYLSGYESGRNDLSETNPELRRECNFLADLIYKI